MTFEADLEEIRQRAKLGSDEDSVGQELLVRLQIRSRRSESRGVEGAL